MIVKITHKEYKQLKALHENRFVRELIFKASNGKHYKCSNVDAAGIKEIIAFNKKLKDEEKRRIKLDLFSLK